MRESLLRSCDSFPAREQLRPFWRRSSGSAPSAPVAVSETEGQGRQATQERKGEDREHGTKGKTTGTPRKGDDGLADNHPSEGQRTQNTVGTPWAVATSSVVNVASGGTSGPQRPTATVKQQVAELQKEQGRKDYAA